MNAPYHVVALIPSVHWRCPKTAPTPCRECRVPGADCPQV